MSSDTTEEHLVNFNNGEQSQLEENEIPAANVNRVFFFINSVYVEPMD